MNQHRKIERPCAGCGQSFMARAADVRRGLGKACSVRCSGKLGGRPETKASHPFTEASHPILRVSPRD